MKTQAKAKAKNVKSKAAAKRKQSGNSAAKPRAQTSKKKAPKKAAARSRGLIKLKSILVPMDFSECSMKALDYAIAFAGQFQAKITLLYVVDLPIVASEMGMFIDQPIMENEFRQNAETQLKKLARDKIGRSTKYETLISCGRAYPEIVEAASSLQTDLIIIATHGYSGFQHAFMGGTTERVARHAPCPVLVVREKEHEFI